MSNICPISQDILLEGVNSNGVKLKTILPCNHSYTTDSILKWLRIKGSGTDADCPICRQKFTFENILSYHVDDYRIRY